MLYTDAANFNKGQFYSIDLTPKLSSVRLFPEGEGFLDGEPRYHPIKGNSLEVEWNKPIDFLFIDSGHEYNLTIGELKKFTSFVKEGGFICMHDTGENNNMFADCRKAMIDFTKDKGWEIKQLNNQNGLSIIRKI